MRSSSDFQSRSESAQNIIINFFQSCMRCLPCLQRRRQIHPCSSNSDGRKFVALSSQKLIRVIHVDCDSKILSVRDSIKSVIKQPSTSQSRRNSKIILSDIDSNEYKRRSHSMISNISEQSSEDYRFTHWSRPYKTADVCNCSFRTSWRSSFRDSKFSDVQNTLVEVKENQNNSPEITIHNEKILVSSINCFANGLVEKIFQEVVDQLCCEIKGNGDNPTSYNWIPKVHSTPYKNELICNREEVTFSRNGFVCNNQGVLNPSFVNHPSDPASILNNEDNVESNSQNANSLEGEQCKFSLANKTKKICDHKLSSNEGSDFAIGDNTIQFSGNVTENPVLKTNSSSDKAEHNFVENPTVVTRRVQSKCHEKCNHNKNFKRLKPLIYFLHGAGCSADIWLRLMKHFAKSGFESVAPDLLGHGYSSAPDNSDMYSFSNILKDTVEIFDKFADEQRKCVVIGHAYGCSLAAALSRCRPQQVIQLVLISGGGPTPLAPHTADCKPMSSSTCLIACMQPLLKCGFRRNTLYSTYGKHMVTCNVAGSGVPQYVLNYLSQGQDWAEGDATFHRRITIPTLLVHGMQDPLVPLVHACEMERTIPRSFLEVIPNAGHFSMLETPEKLIHMIKCFIEWWNA